MGPLHPPETGSRQPSMRLRRSSCSSCGRSPAGCLAELSSRCARWPGGSSSPTSRTGWRSWREASSARRSSSVRSGSPGRRSPSCRARGSSARRCGRPRGATRAGRLPTRSTSPCASGGQGVCSRPCRRLRRGLQEGSRCCSLERRRPMPAGSTGRGRGCRRRSGRAGRRRAASRSLRRTLPAYASWPLADIELDGDLWLAEAQWWRRVEQDADQLVRGPLEGRGVVVGVIALLALDAARVGAALGTAALGSSPAAREALDALL